MVFSDYLSFALSEMGILMNANMNLSSYAKYLQNLKVLVFLFAACYSEDYQFRFILGYKRR